MPCHIQDASLLRLHHARRARVDGQHGSHAVLLLLADMLLNALPKLVDLVRACRLDLLEDGRATIT